jgi:hypothetical protein
MVIQITVSCIAESTGKAEFSAICKAICDVLYLARLTEGTLKNISFPVLVYEDHIDTAAI